MAASFTSGHSAGSILGSATAAYGRIMDNWQRARARHERAAQVRRELDACSDRDLADMGLSRADIPAIVRAARDQA